MRGTQFRFAGIAAGLLMATVGFTGCGNFSSPTVSSGTPTLVQPADDPTDATSASPPPATPGMPTGRYDVISGTDHGVSIDWITGPGVIRVSFDSFRGHGVIDVVIDGTNAYDGQFTVSGSTLTPVPGTEVTVTTVGCVGTPDNQCGLEKVLSPMLESDMVFDFTSSTTMTLAGSGFILMLQAQA